MDIRFSLYFLLRLCYTQFMKYDYPTIYNKNVKFLSAHLKLKKAVVLFNTFIPYFFGVAYLLLWLYGAFEAEFGATDFLKIACAPAFTLLLVWVLRLATERSRPYSQNGAGITPLQEKEGESSSFPSRHLASAAVISMAFLPYLPIVGALLFLCTIGLGYTRFALGWHYPSDLFVGFALGFAIGAVPLFF